MTRKGSARCTIRRCKLRPATTPQPPPKINGGKCAGNSSTHRHIAWYFLWCVELSPPPSSRAPTALYNIHAHRDLASLRRRPPSYVLPHHLAQDASTLLLPPPDSGPPSIDFGFDRRVPVAVRFYSVRCPPELPYRLSGCCPPTTLLCNNDNNVGVTKDSRDRFSSLSSHFPASC